jgi:putative restriction endonuclease
VRGFIGHTDAGWWRFLSASPELGEVNFWRPGGRAFAALDPGEPFFFRLKSPVNKIGGFGLFARYAALPVWRAWEVFGLANGVRNELEFVERLERLARRPVSQTSVIGCIAITDCTFLPADALVDVPGTFNPQNLSGSVGLGGPGIRSAS